MKNGGFSKSSIRKGFGRIEKTYRYSFCTGKFRPFIAPLWDYHGPVMVHRSLTWAKINIFSVKKTKKSSKSWNHKLIKEKMFVQNKSKNVPENSKKNWSGKRLVTACWWRRLVTRGCDRIWWWHFGLGFDVGYHSAFYQHHHLRSVLRNHLNTFGDQTILSPT